MSSGNRRGFVVVVAGPDGSGKTAVADALAQHQQGPVLRLHHRPQVLPAKTVHDGPVTEPHKEPTYPTVLSVLKVVYLYLDYLLGWFVNLRPWVRRGGTVVFERGWWDLVVDPVRYRLRPAAAVLLALRIFGRLLPRPSLTVVLHAPPAVLMARKAELPEAELSRQIHAWRSQAPRFVRGLFLDVTAPLDEVVRSIVTDPRWPSSRDRMSVGGGRGHGRPGGTAGRIAISRRGRVRWNVPARPRSVAKAITQLQQPMTPMGQVLWHVGRTAAGWGALRLLPGASAPPDEATAPLRQYVPADSQLAVASSNHPGRYTVLALSSAGHRRLIAKVATDDQGRDQLRREAEHHRLAQALPPPLHAPELLAVEDGALMFEPIAWRPRWQPWRLERDVARALGGFYRAGVERGTGSGGYAHGDCAPWNLLLSERGWYLVDWEEATDDADPFADVFHYLVQAHSLLGRPTAAALMAGLHGDGWIAGVLAAYGEGAGVGIAQVRSHFVEYLERSCVGADVGRADGLAGVLARQKLLESL